MRARPAAPAPPAGGGGDDESDTLSVSAEPGVQGCTFVHTAPHHVTAKRCSAVIPTRLCVHWAGRLQDIQE